jgi:hypothetical protein
MVQVMFENQKKGTKNKQRWPIKKKFIYDTAHIILKALDL